MTNNKKITTENLQVGYGRRLVVDGVSFSVNGGEIISIIGPNGAGKSTILASITGQIESLGGKVSICGRDLARMKENDVAKQVAVVLTKRITPELMSARDVVATGRYPYTGRLGILGDVDHAMVDKALNMTNSTDIADELFDRLSDGQKQRIMLARAICQETDIIVLDEPTTFLDMKYKLDLLKIIKKLAREDNKAIIMSMHELDMVRMVSDKVVCVGENKLVKAGKVEDIFAEDFIQKLFGVQKDEFDPLTGRVFLNTDGVLADDNNKAVSRQQLTARVIMVQGTMSGAGKSMLVAALCRIFAQDGYRVAPFKSQNMSLNSCVTDDGLEMGRAQVMQAEAAGVRPSVYMNPILLKPTDNVGSQVIVNGCVHSNMKAMEYYKRKTEFIPLIKKAFCELAKDNDIIVIEGAGSPAEINLKDNDIVNMGMAHMVDSNVLLIADIDRGGVFAQLLGTLDLLDADEKDRVKGLIVNKFRGDKAILDPGIRELDNRSGIPVVGVVPYMDVRLDDEDSISERFSLSRKGLIDIVVIRLPRISNYTDFDTFEQIEGVSVRYVDNARQIDNPDMIIIPGSKSTVSDMKWMRESGMEIIIRKAAGNGVPIFGICGGYQMLGNSISDPNSVESGESISGLGLLPVSTVMEDEKRTVLFEGTVTGCQGIFENMEGCRVSGYEIHMGRTVWEQDCDGVREFTSAGTGCCRDNIYGTYIHGVFDNKEIVCGIVETLAKNKNIDLNTDEVMDYSQFKEREYDRLAKIVREHMDMKAVYGALNLAGIEE